MNLISTPIKLVYLLEVGFNKRLLYNYLLPGKKDKGSDLFSWNGNVFTFFI